MHHRLLGLTLLLAACGDKASDDRTDTDTDTDAVTDTDDTDDTDAGPSGPPQPYVEIPDEAYAELQAASSTPVWGRANADGEVVAMGGTFERIAGDPSSAAEAAAFLQEFRALMPAGMWEGVTNARVDAGVGGHDVVTYDVALDGVPVVGAYVKVDLLRGAGVRYAVARIPSGQTVQTPASVDAATAEATALAHLGSSAPAEAASDPTPVVYNAGLLFGGSSESVLAWAVDVGAPDAEVRVFVDAQSGAVLSVEDLAPTELDLSLYGARNQASRLTVLGSGGTPAARDLLYTEAGAVDAAPVTAQATAVYGHVQATWDYYAFTHDFPGIDGEDGPLDVYVHYHDEDWDNAMYASGALWFSDSRDALDTFVHEYTHGVIDHTARLRYRNYSGAVNEHLADVMAAFLDLDEPWEHGGRYDDGPVRDLSDPFVALQPSHWEDHADVRPQGACRDAEPLCDDDLECVGGQCMDGDDNGQVHHNSGVLNHAIYLLAAGTPGSTNQHVERSTPVESVGTLKAERIVFDALSFLGPSSDFHDYADALLAACKDHVTSGTSVPSGTFAYRDCGAVVNALYAVGLWPAADRDYDTLHDDRDGCPDDYDPLAPDDDRDGIPDACDDVYGARIRLIARNVHEDEENIHLFVEGETFGDDNRVEPGRTEQRDAVVVGSSGTGFTLYAGRGGRVIDTATCVPFFVNVRDGDVYEATWQTGLGFLDEGEVSCDLRPSP